MERKKSQLVWTKAHLITVHVTVLAGPNMNRRKLATYAHVSQEIRRQAPTHLAHTHEYNVSGIVTESVILLLKFSLAPE
jgi:hypothetical protein